MRVRVRVTVRVRVRVRALLPLHRLAQLRLPSALRAARPPRAAAHAAAHAAAAAVVERARTACRRARLLEAGTGRTWLGLGLGLGLGLWLGLGLG